MHRNIFALKSSALQVGLALFSAGISFAAPTSSTITGGQNSQGNSTLEEDATLLDPVTVAAHSFGIPMNETGVSVTQISAKKMEDQGIYSLDEAIRYVPGTYVANMEGQRGANSAIRLRGLNSSSYTLTVVDGIRISDSNMPGSAFMGTQNMIGFQNIEVVRGPEGAVYGAQAVGGIVSFTLPTGKGDPSLRLFAEGGSFGSFTGAVITQGEVKQLAYYIMGGYETTQNDPQNPHPPYINDPGYQDYNQWFEAAKFVLSINDKSKASFSFRRSDNTFERPDYDPATDWGGGYVTGTDMIYRIKDKSDFTFLSGSYEAELSKFWATELLGGYYANNFDEYTSGNTWTGDYNNEYKKWQVEWKNQLSWSDSVKTTLGTAWDRVEYSQDGATPQNNSDNENIYALYAEQLYAPTEGLDFTLAGRWEHYDSWSNQYSWRFGTSWQVTGKDSPTRLFATVGSGFQAPSLVDLWGYGNPSGYNYWLPNPDLNPTEAIGYDLGIEQKLDKNNTLKVTGFWTHIKDIIVTQNYTQRINNGKADAYGVEFLLSGDFKDIKDAGYNLAYTYTNPIYADGVFDGKQLPATARHTIAGAAHYSPWAPLTVGVGITAALKRTNYDSAPNYLDDYSNVRIFAKWKISDNVTIHGRVENLLNDKYVLADEYYGPLMARRVGFFGGVTIDF